MRRGRPSPGSAKARPRRRMPCPFVFSIRTPAWPPQAVIAKACKPTARRFCSLAAMLARIGKCRTCRTRSARLAGVPRVREGRARITWRRVHARADGGWREKRAACYRSYGCRVVDLRATRGRRRIRHHRGTRRLMPGRSTGDRPAERLQLRLPAFGAGARDDLPRPATDSARWLRRDSRRQAGERALLAGALRRARRLRSGCAEARVPRSARAGACATRSVTAGSVPS